MALPSDASQALLRDARSLNEARDYPALARLLADAPQGVFEESPELSFLQADVWRRTGRADEALVRTRHLEKVCQLRGNDRLARLRTNLEGMLLFDRGETAEAERVWLALLSQATSARDEEFEARATNNLGVIFSLQRRGAEALSSFARSIDAYRRLGHLRGLAQSHQNLAITYREMGFPGEADRHFGRALDLAEQDRSEDEIARIEQERALSLVLWGDHRLARVTAERSLERYRQLGDPAGQGECRRVLGLMHLVNGNWAAAEPEFHAARDLAVQGRAALLEAEIIEALAGVALMRADRASARRLRSQASRMFRRIGSRAWGRAARDRIDAMIGSAPRREPDSSNY